jgi:hypothetical protein
MVAVLSAGCSNALGGSGTGSSGGDNTATAQTDNSGGDNTAATQQQAVKFAACMRSNGVKAFPDPDASGTLTIDGVANGSSLDTSSASFKQAIAAWKGLQPPGFMGHKRTAQEQEYALKFAQCIRDNGVKDFPDPTPDGPLVDVDGSKPGVKAALDVAMQQCRDLAASAGVQGGR